MTKKSVILTRDELNDIIVILGKFPNVSQIEIMEKGGKNGIGSNLYLNFEYTLRDVVGEFSTMLRGPGSW